MVLGEQTPSPQSTTTPPSQEVLGEQPSGGAPPSRTTAPSSAQSARPAAAAGKSLPFTGTDAIGVALVGVLVLLAGLGLRHFASQRAQ